jgi:hypothetical protein
MLEGPGMQNGNKGSWHKRAAASEDLEDIRWVRKEGFRTEVREASSRDAPRVVENEELDSMEGSARSELKERTSSVSVRRDGYVGPPPIVGNFAPIGWEKEEKLWIMVIHLDLLAL